MRLIDADALINDTKQFCGKNEVEWTTNKVLTWIDSQPTAYDPDKVVEQLECYAMWKDVMIYDLTERELKIIRKAIEIVKKGGVE